MPKSTAQKLAQQKYDQKSYDQILIKVKKGKRDEYQQAAESLGLGQMELFRRGVEEFIANHVSEVMTPAPMAAQSADKLSAEQKRLLDEFSKLPADAQKSLMKFLKTINAQEPAKQSR